VNGLTFLGGLREERRWLVLNCFAAALWATQVSSFMLGNVFYVLENLAALHAAILVRRHGASPIEGAIL
jgi:hypothetical protein